MLYPVLYSAGVYFVVGLNPSIQSFSLFTVILVTNVLAAQSIGLLVSTLLMNVREAQVLGTLWILGSMLTSGYHVDPDNTPSFVLPFRYLSFIKVRHYLRYCKFLESSKISFRTHITLTECHAICQPYLLVFVRGDGQD